jgi:hypothetical protein
MIHKFLTPIIVSMIFFSQIAFSQSRADSIPKKSGSLKRNLEAPLSGGQTPTTKKEVPEQTKEMPQQAKEELEDSDLADTKIVEPSRTNIDFSESLIDGKMNAPSGFLIQGRLSQDLTRMVRLRTSFKPEILKSTGIPDKKP